MLDPVLELFEERAAIREFCGGQTRLEAEHGAYWDVRKIFGRERIPKQLHERHVNRYKQDSQGKLFA